MELAKDIVTGEKILRIESQEELLLTNVLTSDLSIVIRFGSVKHPAIINKELVNSSLINKRLFIDSFCHADVDGEFKIVALPNSHVIARHGTSVWARNNSEVFIDARRSEHENTLYMEGENISFRAVGRNFEVIDLTEFRMIASNHSMYVYNWGL